MSKLTKTLISFLRPFHHEANQHNNGGGTEGKTTLCKRIMRELNPLLTNIKYGNAEGMGIAALASRSTEKMLK
jgi:hypothetical protein